MVSKELVLLIHNQQVLRFSTVTLIEDGTLRGLTSILKSTI